MGCGNSKEAEGDDKAIKTEFKEVKIAEFDTFFNQAKETLEAAEEIRDGLEGCPDDLKELCEGWRLKEYKMVEAVRIWMWALSQNAGGKIANTKFTTHTEVPFFDFDNNNLIVDTVSMGDRLKKFLKVAITAPVKVPEVLGKLQELVNKGQELVKTAPDAAKNAGLGMGALTAVKNAGLNMKLVASGLAKFQKLPALAADAAANAKEVIGKLKEFFDKADEVGAKAVASSDRYPKYITKAYHPGLKTEAELAAAEKENEAGEKGKKGKKDNKKKENKKDEKKEEKKTEEKKPEEKKK